MIEEVNCKTILSQYRSPTSWLGVNYNMNLYKGCNHGCIYCDSRSSCYQIDNFEQVKVKKDALRILNQELQSKKRKGVIGTGAMSDPYNHLEETLLLTRQSLELINHYHYGLSILTKSCLIKRDLDIIAQINTHSPVLVAMTITTSDDKLCSIIEPDVDSSSQRFECLKAFKQQGIFCGILLMPILPFINDNIENLKGIIDQAIECDLDFILPAFGMTLRQGNREYYYQQLDQHFPGLKQLYITNYHESYSLSSPNAKDLYEYLKKECEKHHILYRQKDICRYMNKTTTFQQLSLF